MVEISDPCIEIKRQEKGKKKVMVIWKTTPCPFPHIVNGCQGICCEFYSNGVWLHDYLQMSDSRACIWILSQCPPPRLEPLWLWRWGPSTVLAPLPSSDALPAFCTCLWFGTRDGIPDGKWMWWVTWTGKRSHCSRRLGGPCPCSSGIWSLPFSAAGTLHLLTNGLW